MMTFEERVLCGNPLQRFGSGLEPDPEPTWDFGPVANTSVDMAMRLCFRDCNEIAVLLARNTWPPGDFGVRTVIGPIGIRVHYQTIADVTADADVNADADVYADADAHTDADANANANAIAGEV
jgi:hypothetical protein